MWMIKIKIKNKIIKTMKNKIRMKHLQKTRVSRIKTLNLLMEGWI